MKTKHNVDRKYGIASCRILKKKVFWKMKKWQIENSKIFSEIFKSKFSILPYSQNRKLGFKNFGKKFSEFLAGKAILNDHHLTTTNLKLFINHSYIVKIRSQGWSLKLQLIKRVFTWDFISGKMDIFSFRCLVNFF